MINKKYFAKYLPVEGEIKEGEPRLDLLSGEIFKTGPHLHKMPAPIQAASKPVKLFLCSRDIQVGDDVDFKGFKGKVLFDKSTGYSVMNGNVGYDFIYGHDDVFKVIGEISPDATWVKEGDEFDEDEWTCNRIEQRIACSEHGYPASEALCSTYEEGSPHYIIIRT